ncbi:hypothetical protein D3C85_1566090 [compost metagenome]
MINIDLNSSNFSFLFCSNRHFIIKIWQIGYQRFKSIIRSIFNIFCININIYFCSISLNCTYCHIAHFIVCMVNSIKCFTRVFFFKSWKISSVKNFICGWFPLWLINPCFLSFCNFFHSLLFFQHLFQCNNI